MRTLDLPVHHFNVRMGKFLSNRGKDIHTFIHSSIPCVRDIYFLILWPPKCLGSGSISWWFCDDNYTSVTYYCAGDFNKKIYFFPLDSDVFQNTCSLMLMSKTRYAMARAAADDNVISIREDLTKPASFHRPSGVLLQGISAIP